LIDGNRVPKGIKIPCETIVKGDAKSSSIAAASILAKVSRDRLLLEYDKKYPEYNFAKHKGYGTKEHTEAILKYGPSEIHRLSFLKNILEKAK
jgi:ribonuclease HII